MKYYMQSTVDTAHCEILTLSFVTKPVITARWLFLTSACCEQGQVGFLDDWRRMNVGITRPKRAMVLVGNEKTLCLWDKRWRGLLEFLEVRGCVLRGLQAVEV